MDMDMIDALRVLPPTSTVCMRVVAFGACDALVSSAQDFDVPKRRQAGGQGRNSMHARLLLQGTPDAPRCGFSKRVVGILRSLGEDFGTFDVLSDEAVRQGVKRYSDWPTFPQLFVRHAHPLRMSSLLLQAWKVLACMHTQHEHHAWLLIGF